jgi:hypothetical protein
MFHFKNYVRKITLKSPSQYLVRLQEILILTEKEKIYIFIRFY